MDYDAEDAEDAVPESLREAWQNFAQGLPEGACVEIVHGGDVDALCGAAIATGGLQTLGLSVHRRRLPEGKQPLQLVCGAHTFKLDPDANAGEAVSAFLLWLLLHEQVDMQPFAWFAAIAWLERHGMRATSPFLKMAKARFTAKFLRQVLTWCVLAPYAERDLRDDLLDAMCTHRDPRGLIQSQDAKACAMRAAEVAICEAQTVAGTTTPHLAGRMALIRMSSPCQIQSLVAAEWSRRLPDYVVMVANEAAHKVRLATRSASRLSIADFLRSLALPLDFVPDGEVPLSTWQDVLRKCGDVSQLPIATNTALLK